jgi:hypothetical protein
MIWSHNNLKFVNVMIKFQTEQIPIYLSHGKFIDLAKIYICLSHGKYQDLAKI